MRRHQIVSSLLKATITSSPFADKTKTSSLPHLVLEKHPLRGLMRIVRITIDRRRLRRFPLRIHQLRLRKPRHPKRRDDVVLQLRKPHAQARMPAHTPPDPGVRFPLVFRAIGQVTRRIPRRGVPVDRRVAVDFGKGHSGVGFLRHGFGAGFVQGDGRVGGVLAEESAAADQADVLFQAEVDGGKFGFPGFDGDAHQAVDEGEGGVGAVAVGDGGDFFVDQVVPVRVFAEVDEDPGGVDAGVELACEEGADDELGSNVRMVGSGHDEMCFLR